MRTTVALLLILSCAALNLNLDEKEKALQKKMAAADWSKGPKQTFMKFFGKSKGLTRHSLSDAQMEKLLVEVKNKTEWQAASMTTYWDCSSQYCISHKSGREAMMKNSCPNIHNDLWHLGPRRSDHASEKLGLFQGEDGHLYGTVAASGSLGVDNKNALGCGKCYTVRRGEDASFGGFYPDTKLTVMVSNWCPDSRDAPCPAAGKTGEFGTKFHFDLAVPGGGMGSMPTCAHLYEKIDGREDAFEKLKGAFSNTLHQCSLLPAFSKLRDSCKLYHAKVAQYPLNMGLAFAEVDCPPQLTERFECSKPCVGQSCEAGLTWAQLNNIKKYSKFSKTLSKQEEAAWAAKMSIDEFRAQKEQSFREKLSPKKK